MSRVVDTVMNFWIGTVNARSHDSVTSSRNYWNPLTPFTGDETLGSLIDKLITLMLGIAGALAVIYLIVAGITYITAGGEPTKADKARTGIVNAVIGIIIIVLAFVIEKVVAGLFSNSGGGAPWL